MTVADVSRGPAGEGSARRLLLDPRAIALVLLASALTVAGGAAGLGDKAALVLLASAVAGAGAGYANSGST